jgi:hypothetical protein
VTKADKSLNETKRLMGALVRMKPKQHNAMKVGKKKVVAKESARKTSKRNP